MITRVSGGFILSALCAAAGLAQPQPPQAFDAVSIKMSGPNSQRGESGGPVSNDPGQYSFNRATLLDLIGIAYHVQPFQVSSKVPLQQENYDLLAKVPRGVTVDQFRMLVRNLLAERFHLKLHIEQKEFTAYELHVAKTGAKLTKSSGAPPPPSSVDDGFPAVPEYGGIARRFSMVDGYVLTRLRGRETTMANLARWISIPNEPAVVDKTGLAGLYDFTLEFTHELPGAPPDPSAQLPAIPDLFGAVREQLGLQLMRQRVPFDFLVIDSVELRPTEN